MALRLLKPDEGARNMGCIVWLEDLERAGMTYGDYIGFLADLHMAVVCSPVHDRDQYTAEDVRGWVKRHIDPDTGEVAGEYSNAQPSVGDHKKPHIHTYFCHKGQRKPKYMSEVMGDFIPGLIAPNRWALVPDWGRIVRYCAHMDSPDKAQYSPFDVLSFGNADVSALSEDTNVDKLAVSLEIEQAIRTERIKNYWQLNQWANATGDRELMSVVKGRTAYFVSLFNARRQEAMDRKEREKQEQAVRDVQAMCARSDENMDELIG